MIAPCTLGIMTNLMRFEKKENKIIYELKQNQGKIEHWMFERGETARQGPPRTGRM